MKRYRYFKSKRMTLKSNRKLYQKGRAYERVQRKGASKFKW